MKPDTRKKTRSLSSLAPLCARVSSHSAGACGAYVLVGLIGEERQREQQLMLLVAVFAGLLLLLGATNDGPNVAKGVFAEEVLLAAADIFGALVGTAVAVLLSVCTSPVAATAANSFCELLRDGNVEVRPRHVRGPKMKQKLEYPADFLLVFWSYMMVCH